MSFLRPAFGRPGKESKSNKTAKAAFLQGPYGDVVIVLSTVLRIKRTLNGREIDQIILDVETRKVQAIEQQRRADWRKSELEASRFRAECDYLHRAVATSKIGQVQ